MYGWMDVSIQIYIYIYTYVCVSCLYIYASEYRCIYLQRHTSHVYIYVRENSDHTYAIYIYIDICTHIYMCIHITYIRVHIYIHECIYACVLACLRSYSTRLTNFFVKSLPCDQGMRWAFAACPGPSWKREERALTTGISHLGSA